jgi:hypothetical protein
MTMTSTHKMESNTMNNARTLEKEWKIPREMVAFVAKCPRLLPGESEDSYRKLFVMMVDEIEPQTASEYLVTADITGLFWDIGRYRAWKDGSSASIAAMRWRRHSGLPTTTKTPWSVKRRPSLLRRGRRPKNGARIRQNARS